MPRGARRNGSPNFLRIHNEAVDELETQQQEGRWILVSERRMRNGGLAGLRMDITDLKRIQGALHDSERRLRDFAEMASDWFWEQDADANFSWVSEGRGATPMAERPYLGKPRWAMFPGGATPEQWEAHKADIAAQRPIRDFRYRRGDSLGRPRHISIHGVPVYDAGGAFTGYRGIGRDITEQIESEQELERAKERAEQAETLLRDAVDSISEGFVIFDARRSAGDVQRGLSPDLRRRRRRAAAGPAFRNVAAQHHRQGQQPRSARARGRMAGRTDAAASRGARRVREPAGERRGLSGRPTGA